MALAVRSAASFAFVSQARPCPVPRPPSPEAAALPASAPFEAAGRPIVYGNTFRATVREWLRRGRTVRCAGDSGPGPAPAPPPRERRRRQAAPLDGRPRRPRGHEQARHGRRDPRREIRAAGPAVRPGRVPGPRRPACADPARGAGDVRRRRVERQRPGGRGGALRRRPRGPWTDARRAARARRRTRDRTHADDRGGCGVGARRPRVGGVAARRPDSPTGRAAGTRRRRCPPAAAAAGLDRPSAMALPLARGGARRRGRRPQRPVRAGAARGRDAHRRVAVAGRPRDGGAATRAGRRRRGRGAAARTAARPGPRRRRAACTRPRGQVPHRRRRAPRARRAARRRGTPRGRVPGVARGPGRATRRATKVAAVPRGSPRCADRAACCRCTVAGPLSARCPAHAAAGPRRGGSVVARTGRTGRRLGLARSVRPPVRRGPPRRDAPRAR